MHKCVRCGRSATSIIEIDAGCPCGSKAFIYIRELEQQPDEAEAKLLAKDAPAAVQAPPQAVLQEIGEDPELKAGSPQAKLGREAELAGDAQTAPGTAQAEGSARAKEGQMPQRSHAPAAQEGNGKADAYPGLQGAAAPAQEGNGKVPPSYYARMSFTSEDVENVKVLTEGVFALDVNGLSRDPMVLKDGEGVYYVKIPFGQRKRAEGKKE